MERQLEIRRIDLLVHPFFYERHHYTEEEAEKLLGLWKKHVDEVAADQNRLLLIVRSDVQSTPQKKKSRELVKYAKTKLGNRCGFFENPINKNRSENVNRFHDNTGKPFKSFWGYAKAKGFKVEKSTVKTRALGEYAHVCVTDYLFDLNRNMGMKNAVPFRNPQSTILPRKSVAAYGNKTGISEVLNFKELAKSSQGEKKIRAAAKEYSKRRLRKASLLMYYVGSPRPKSRLKRIK